MPSKELIKKLNEQIKHEFFSAHYYLAMAAFCSQRSLDGFANFFIAQAAEERFHAMKFFNFLADIGETPQITGFDDPRTDFSSLEEVFRLSLEHEQLVSKLIHQILELAQEEKHHPTVNFLQWFVEEQVEEEATMGKLLDEVKLTGDNTPGVLFLDRELAKREFSE